MIVVLDIDLGNVGSIMNMLKKIGVPAVLASRCDEIEKAKKLILPGVGSFDQAMVNLSELKLIDVLNEKVTKEKIPVLGICLGAQIMTRSSEEGSRPGLGWIAGRTVRFDFRGEACKLKIPHMGWNHVQLRKESALLPQSAEPEDSRFYFVHAYHFLCDQEDDILAVSPCTLI